MGLTLALGLEGGLARIAVCVFVGITPLGLPAGIKAGSVWSMGERRARALDRLGAVLFDHLGSPSLRLSLGKISALGCNHRVAVLLKLCAELATARV